jgi:hypothetical protein
MPISGVARLTVHASTPNNPTSDSSNPIAPSPASSDVAIRRNVNSWLVASTVVRTSASTVRSMLEIADRTADRPSAGDDCGRVRNCRIKPPPV